MDSNLQSSYAILLHSFESEPRKRPLPAHTVFAWRSGLVLGSVAASETNGPEGPEGTLRYLAPTATLSCSILAHFKAPLKNRIGLGSGIVSESTKKGRKSDGISGGFIA